MLVYVYACFRDDGFTHAVGMVTESGPVRGAIALFEDGADATAFATRKAEEMGFKVAILGAKQD